MRTIRIAAAITRACLAQPSENLTRLQKLTAKAADQGARVICFPELNISGYTSRSELDSAAETLDGPSMEILMKTAARRDILILAGLAEKNKSGQIYASHVVVGPKGLIGVYRKLHLAPPEVSVFKPADDIPLFNYEGMTFGLQLCYDAHFPALSTWMATNGADVIFMPHASPRGTPHEKYRSWMRHLTARAYDNSVFIVACNQTGENSDGLTFPGLAVAINPSGELIAKRYSKKDALLVTDLDADVLSAVRGHPMRHFMPNQRPTLYQNMPVRIYSENGSTLKTD